MGIDVQGGLCLLVTGEILDGFDVYTGKEKVRDGGNYGQKNQS
jgi:hypothetical protein